MLSFVGNSIITGIIWGFQGLASSMLGKSTIEGSTFLKLLVYGLVSIVFYLYFKKEINHDLLDIYKKDKQILLIFLIVMLLSSTVAQWCYFKAFNISKNKTHLIITIIQSATILVAVFGSSYFFNEPLNMFSYIGAFFVIFGIYCMKQLGPK